MPWRLIIGLTLLGCLGNFVGDIYLGTMPDIVHALHTTHAAVQRSMSMYLMAFCVFQFLAGPWLDALGRRRPATLGLGVSMLGSIMIMLTSSLVWFNVGRFLEGVGCAIATVTSRALVRDLTHSAEETSGLTSKIVIFAIAMISLAPFLGAWVGYLGHWRLNFMLTVLVMVGALVGLRRLTKQDMTLSGDLSSRLKEAYRHYGRLLTHQPFLALVLISAMIYGVMLAYAVSAPFLLQHLLGHTKVEYAWINGAVSVAGLVASFVHSKQIQRSNSRRMMEVGLLIFGGGAAFLWVCATTLQPMGVVLWCAITMMMVGAIYIFPNVFSLAMHVEKGAGNMASCYGGFQVLGGVVGTGLVSLGSTESFVSLGLYCLLSSILCLFLWSKWVADLEP